jgi:hypothetical protein
MTVLELEIVLFSFLFLKESLELGAGGSRL